MDEGPSSMKLWKNKFFFIDCRAIPDYLTWRSSQSRVSDDFLTVGYDHNDVTRLCARLARLRGLNEVVLVWSGLSSVWLNRKCDSIFRRKDDNSVMSNYDFMTLPSWGDAKVIEEPHEFTDSILQRVQNHTTAPAAKGAPIPRPTPEDVVANQPDPKLSKRSKAPLKRKASTSLVGPSEAAQPKRKRRLKSIDLEAGSSAPVVVQVNDVEDVILFEADYCSYIEGSLERDEGNSSRAESAPILRSGNRLRSAPPCAFNPVLSDPSYAGTSTAANAPSYDYADVRRGTILVGSVGKAQAEVIRWQLDPMDMLARSTLARDHEYDYILDDDFSTATLGEEIDHTLFPLALGPYCMSYPFADGKGSDPLKYTREEWDRPHAPKANILTKEIFKDSDVCKRALDCTITPAELERTESLLPL
ncbi:hypothetical protein Tco_1173356 [Tanacetum coccineum]